MEAVTLKELSANLATGLTMVVSATTELAVGSGLTTIASATAELDTNIGAEELKITFADRQDILDISR